MFMAGMCQEGRIDGSCQKRGATRNRWIILCDANMEPCEFRVGTWCHGAKAHVKVLVNGVTTCCTESARRCEVNKVHD